MKPVILKYKGYRIVREDELNLKHEVYKGVKDYEDNTKTHKAWVFIGFYASLALALGALTNELVSTPSPDTKTLSSTVKYIELVLEEFGDCLDSWAGEVKV